MIKFVACRQQQLFDVGLDFGHRRPHPGHVLLVLDLARMDGPTLSTDFAPRNASFGRGGQNALEGHFPVKGQVLDIVRDLRVLLRGHLPVRVSGPIILHQQVRDEFCQRQLHQRTHLPDLGLRFSLLWHPH